MRHIARIRAAFLFAASIGLAASATVRSDGLIYQLPADGSWADYELKATMTVGDQQMTQSGRMRISSVGKAKEQGADCRWIEIKTTETNPPEPDECYKYLVPEKNLKAGADIIGSVVRGWKKVGDGEVARIDREAVTGDFGPATVLFIGPLKDVKKLEKQEQEIAGLGKLSCERESGKGEIQVDVDNRVPVEVTVSRNTRSPFGVVEFHMDAKLERGGVKANMVITVKLLKTGTDAKSDLPSSN